MKRKSAARPIKLLFPIQFNRAQVNESHSSKLIFQKFILASTSALLPDSVNQLNDCLKKCSVSSIFLKRLIQTKRFELVSEAVTEIFKQTMIMLEATKPRNGDSESR